MFPVRVWRHFLRRNGFLLSAGMAYQALFALFALLYVAFAGAGVWVGGSDVAVDAMIRAVNSYIPGLIGPDGILTPEAVRDVAGSAAGTFTLTGAIAVAVVLWTAVGAVTFTRRAVRGIFALPFDSRSYVLLKLRDAAAAAVFGISLLLGAAISVGGVWALRALFEMLGRDVPSATLTTLVSASSVLVIVVIDVTAIAALVRFLTGTTIRWRRIAPGSVIGGVAVAVLQLGAGLLLAHTPGNPLLATFAVMVGLLLWCRLIAAVILLAASWIALSADDRDEPLLDRDALPRPLHDRPALPRRDVRTRR
ncbi:YihY/virulence factor BrkB family protein [Microbacterium esteraromaticum]|uniref:YihY/virulence factor BrkB family protein n=1 Tax=Microbacterium esteraromaticum TaxID=57043 RepID=A0A7D7WF01_9MICO|nr:YihY/virulence factor BrkB family protein [Microbacterium esteraromaticum]QMU95854.1 YihY/virulence factor BrkB family protein [Microbacterium esteraromaticum]